MARRLFVSLIVLLLMSQLTPVAAQAGCAGLAPRLHIGQQGQVSYVDGSPLNVRAEPGRAASVVGKLAEGTRFNVLAGPTCADSINWWQIESGGVTGWAAEGVGGQYFVEPLAVANAPQGAATVPPASAGQSKLPTLPVNLSGVLFVRESQLDAAQQALLAQNGFVVVPAGRDQFDDVYGSYPDIIYPADGVVGDDQTIGRPNFVTTDLMLHSLHFIFDNLLTDLERDEFEPRMAAVITASLDAAQKQAQQATGTPLEQPAQSALIYLAIAAETFAPGSAHGLVSGASAAQVDQVASLIAGAVGQAPLDFLGGYLEDFSQYRPRGHYAGDDALERYFRGMMWISRITFLANDDAATRTALLVNRALHHGQDAFAGWQTVHDLLDYLIGPVDDLGPVEYGTLADRIFGSDLQSVADSAKLKAFRDAVAALPGPRINGLANPDPTGDLSDKTKGYRFLGQRFTLDGLIMQQLMWPYVGTEENKRLLPLALDVASSMGSDTAYALAQQAGATDYAHYDTQTQALRGQLGALAQDQWLANTYSGWLWTLEPLLTRDAQPYPPFMQTQAWLLKDLNTALASWTELKHDTVLYAKQPTGFGGGGPPLFSYGYVEPNPRVFERLSTVASVTTKGLTARLYGGSLTDPNQGPITIFTDLQALSELASRCAAFAQMARKELAGQPLTDDEYFDIELIGEYEYVLLNTLNQTSEPTKPVALVTDVASNPSIGKVLQEGVGGVDHLYVVIPGPKGLQVAIGAVFSYYEWVGDINRRMTDEEWRALVAARQQPARPEWTQAYLSGAEPPPATPSGG